MARQTWLSSDNYYENLVETSVKNASAQLFKAADATTGGAETLPPKLNDWLGRLRLLYGIPFSYLVPHPSLLPIESVRFFYIDRNWTDRLVDGALSVGKTTSRDYAHHQAVADGIDVDLNNRESQVRPNLGRLQLSETPRAGGTLTGMLFRSRIVSGWPGLEIKAYINTSEERLKKDRLRIIRMDRLAEDVMLVIFSGVPRRVDIEEPGEGIQFGVEGNPEGQTSSVPSGFTLALRNIVEEIPGDEIKIGNTKESINIPLPVRRANRRVVHFQQLATDLTDALKDENRTFVGNGPSVDAADLAVQLLQFPYRQSFSGDGDLNNGNGNLNWLATTSYADATFIASDVVPELTNNEIKILFGK